MTQKKLKTENLIMIKKYYIEEKDGKEIKRKQTIHEFEDWQDLPHKEQVTLDEFKEKILRDYSNEPNKKFVNVSYKLLDLSHI